MKIKGRIIEVGSDGHHPYVRIHVQDIEAVRTLGRNLYEHVEVEIKELTTCYSRPDANIDTIVCSKGHDYSVKSPKAGFLIKHGLCWNCEEMAIREESGASAVELIEAERKARDEERNMPRPGCHQCGPTMACSFHYRA